MRLRAPCLADHAGCAAQISFFDICARPDDCGGDQIGGLFVGCYRSFAGFDCCAFFQYALGFGQGKNRIAAAMHITMIG